MNLVYETNNTLYHYGVLGMKWGRRKGSSGKSSGKRKYKDAEIMKARDDINKLNKEYKEMHYKRYKMYDTGKRNTKEYKELVTKMVDNEKKRIELSNVSTMRTGKEKTTNALRSIGGLAIGTAATMYFISKKKS